ncbi:MAG: hypothetical protein ACTSXL_02570, partial [Alphaproteobacteria bacterium]
MGKIIQKLRERKSKNKEDIKLYEKHQNEIEEIAKIDPIPYQIIRVENKPRKTQKELYERKKAKMEKLKKENFIYSFSD